MGQRRLSRIASSCALLALVGALFVPACGEGDGASVESDVDVPVSASAGNSIRPLTSRRTLPVQ